MDGESHGGEAAAVELAEGQEDAQAQQQAEVGAVASSDSGYEAQLARRDERITELEAQVAEARSVKAARALRDEHGGDVSALKEAEPWLFSAAPAPTGATGLPNAGAASDKGRMLRRWERLAGLDKDDE